MPLVIALDRVALPRPAEAAGLAEEFGRTHCIRLAGFLAPSVLEWIRSRVREEHFVERRHPGFTQPLVDVYHRDDQLSAMLFTLLNDERLFRTVEGITDCDRIGSFLPLIYRIDPTMGHQNDWHGDNDGNRLAALSVNIGGPFEGGALQVRDRATGRITADIRNTGAGDALLFRIRPDLQHQVAPLEGTASRLSLVGWFQRLPKARPASFPHFED